MSHFHVAFYKELLNSAGIPLRCLQADIDVPDAPDASAAVSAAKREFERVRDIPDWKIHADFLETKEVST